MEPSQNNKQKSTPLKLVIIDFAAGSFGGIMRVLVGQPFDTVRVRMQHSSKNTKILQQFSKAIKDDGILSLFRGMSTPLIGLPFLTALNFTTYGTFKQILNTKEYKAITSIDEKISLIQNGHSKTDQIKFFISGGLAGFVQSSFICTVELCKSVIQVAGKNIDNPCDSTINKKQIKIDPKIGAIGAGKFIAKNLGIKYLFKGVLATTLRDTPGYAFYYYVYEFCKDMYMKRYVTIDNYNNQDKISSLIAGTISGITSWSIIYPFDVIKTRIQADFQGLKYKGIIDCFQKSLLDEGSYKFLYKGYTVTIMRAGPVAACSFTGYEIALKELHYLNSKF